MKSKEFSIITEIRKIYNKLTQFQMGTIEVNGMSFQGNSVSMKNGKIIIDGIDVTPESKNITVDVKGNIETLDVGQANSVTITGNVGKAKSSQGDITVNGNVTGDVTSSQGDIDISGNVGGSVRTSQGDIKYKK